MDNVLVLVPKITNRLHYTFHLVLTQLLGIKYDFTTDPVRFEQREHAKFVYGPLPVSTHYFIKATPLLFERDIQSQELKVGDFKGIKVFFPIFNRQSMLPYDIFSAVFYLVSRYEEYLPFTPDQHGRFEASSSCLHQHGMLRQPIVNLWSRQLAAVLADTFPTIEPKYTTYTYQPTYDIDAAWSYLHKGFYRTLGSFGRDLIQMDFVELKKRWSVIFGRQKDPFDSFELQLQLQKKYKLNPIYFILFAEYGVNDKNINTRNPAFQQLIKHIADYADVGIHPSYGSFRNKAKLRSEMNGLSDVLNREVTQSRQHFLRLSLPVTYQHLIDLDITDDYSMGYASQPGFRAGIANSFLFYDLDHDVPTHLKIHPITLMDGTLRDYMQQDIEAAMETAAELNAAVRAVGGTFVTLWHNESLSNEKRWYGWVDVYEKIIQMAIS